MSKICLEDINLFYEIINQKRIKDIIVPLNKINKSLVADKTIHALRDLNLELNDGDRLGIIGANGAGKSTLLKLIAGIYPPASGKLTVDGSIATLFELATGFEMEASGWDNILLRGLMLGQTPSQMKNKVLEIAEFSELGEYLNIPVKYYSSGMVIRLAFSVSTAIKPEILLLDEVMAAGDAGFIKKAERRMHELMDNVRILVFVSHSMQSIKDFCNQVIWLENGSFKEIGAPKEVINKYQKYMQEK